MAVDLRRLAALTLITCGALALAQSAHAAPHPSLFPEKWIDGTLPDEPVTQVQALDADTFVIRQSIKTNFEAPFLYLLFGRDKALLVDTGAKDGRIRPTVDRLVSDWLAAHHRTSIPLVVAHSHSHGDHVAGDAAFRERPDTTVLGLKPADVAAFFGIAKWPQQIARFDLGGRVLSVIPTPGHQAAAAMYYDPHLKILLSGDTLYPGRLYVPVNFVPDDRASVDRLAVFAATHPIRAVLGAHIEMTRTPGRDYGHEAQPDACIHRFEPPHRHFGDARKPLEVAEIADAGKRGTEGREHHAQERKDLGRAVKFFVRHIAESRDQREHEVSRDRQHRQQEQPFGQLVEPVVDRVQPLRLRDMVIAKPRNVRREQRFEHPAQVALGHRDPRQALRPQQVQCVIFGPARPGALGPATGRPRVCTCHEPTTRRRRSEAPQMPEE
jgi:hydroxyacylglutathione hydrolase